MGNKFKIISPFDTLASVFPFFSCSLFPLFPLIPLSFFSTLFPFLSYEVLLQILPFFFNLGKNDQNIHPWFLITISHGNKMTRSLQNHATCLIKGIEIIDNTNL